MDVSRRSFLKFTTSSVLLTDVHPKNDTPILAITYCILFKISSFHQFFSRDYTHIPMRKSYRHANI